MNGRVFDPVLARFLSPDPYVQASENTQSFNRYTYCLNNPFKYTDPSGEFFYIIPSISFSSSGVNVSVSAGIGFYGAASAGISVGYGVHSGNWSVTANAAFMGGFVYGGYDSNAGWVAGAGYGFSLTNNPAFSSNLTSIGINWSQRGGWSVNAFGLNHSKNGTVFDPSFSANLTLRWGTTIYEDDIVGYEVGEDLSQEFLYKDDIELNNMVDQYIDKNDYNIDLISAFLDPQDTHSSYGYYRDRTNGYIYYVDDQGGMSKPKRGICVRKDEGFYSTSEIYMSQIRDPERFIRTLNHEITHAFINSRGYERKMDANTFKRFTESAAYQVSDGGIPSQLYNKFHYSGILQLPIPPNLIPLSILK